MGNHSESRFTKTRQGGRKDGRNRQPIRSSGCALFIIVALGVSSAVGYMIVEVL